LISCCRLGHELQFGLGDQQRATTALREIGIRHWSRIADGCWRRSNIELVNFGPAPTVCPADPANVRENGQMIENLDCVIAEGLLFRKRMQVQFRVPPPFYKLLI
jgi:hypothetical protein